MADCSYCGEEKGTEKIANPNLDMGDDIDWSEDNQWWTVCKDCKEVIHCQKTLTIARHMLDRKLAGEMNRRLQEIAERTGKSIMSAQIRKVDGKTEVSSVEFTGKKGDD